MIKTLRTGNNLILKSQLGLIRNLSGTKNLFSEANAKNIKQTRATSRALDPKDKAKSKIVFSNRANGPNLDDFMFVNNQNAEKVPYLETVTDWGENRKFFVEVYGCQMNFNDTEILISVMQQAGYKRTMKMEEADVVFLITCSIREKAENKIWHRLHELKAMRQKRSKKISNSDDKAGISGKAPMVGVLGCMAERLKDKLLDQDKMVDIVCGPDAYRSIPRLLSIRRLTNQGTANVMLSADETYADITPVRLDENSVSAFLSIMRGCNNMCSYCIVPFTRGVERSRDVDSIAGEVHGLREQGVKEIVLLGQNVNSYRDTSVSKLYPSLPALNDTTDVNNDGGNQLSRGFTSLHKRRAHENTRSFADLLEVVAKVDPESLRVSFTSPHPKDFPDSVLATIRDNVNISRNIHLPAQAGSDTVLQRMRRGYTFDSYLRLVENIHKFIPDATLSTDMIVGFCGETDEEFKQTLRLMELVQFDMAYMFAYSLREKTHAHRNYKDDVSPEVKQERLQAMIELFHTLAREKNKKYIGNKVLVLVEGANYNPNDHKSVYGKDQYNHKVFLLPDSNNPTSFSSFKRGDFVTAKVISSSSTSLTAEAIQASTISQYYNALV